MAGKVPVRTWTAIVAVAAALVIGWAAPSVAGTPTTRPGGVSLTSPEAVQIMAGDRAPVAGEITPARKGTRVNIQQQRRGKWVTITTTKTGNGGSFSAAVRLTKAGVYKLRASAGKAGASSPMQVIVLGTYYLADRDVAASDQRVDATEVRMNGLTYPRSIYMRAYAYGNPVAEWDLQRRCSTLTLTAGIPDSQPRESTATLSLSVDQAPATDIPIAWGATQEITFDVSGALRLVVKVDPSGYDKGYDGGLALGNARLTCLPLE